MGVKFYFHAIKIHFIYKMELIWFFIEKYKLFSIRVELFFKFQQHISYRKTDLN